MKKQPEKLKREDLKKLLDTKNTSLEKMKLEIKIEACLEAVRAVSLLMKKREDMLLVCTIIAKQLQLLHVKEIRNVQTAIFYEDKGTYTNYEYYAKHDKTFVTETTYTNHKIHQDFADKMLKGNGEFMEAHIKGAKVKDWIAYQKTTNVFIDDYLNTAASLNYYWFSLGPVALGISTYSPLNKKEINLFKRFLKVFELSYRRYLDIELAIKQAKEARIETALERVRAVAMAMKHSDELASVCEVMFKELISLGFTNIRNAQIAIENDARQSYFFYTYSDFEKIKAGEVGYNSSPLVKALYKELGKSGEGLYEKEYSPAEMIEWRKWRTLLSPLTDPREETAASLCFYMYAIGRGNIGISTFSIITKEQVEIVKRFKKVFELSYTRFDDLQKAETQAREAEIELALERVRARTMAMQHSGELHETTLLLFKQFKDLGQIASQVSIAIFDNDINNVELYITLKGDKIDRSFTIEIGKDPLFWSKARNAFLYGDKLFIKTFAGKELQQYNHLRNEVVGNNLYDESENILGQSWNIYAAFFSKGAVTFSTDKTISDETIKLLERFAKVFEQTYTRFLDLQKSEAQARESQIQLALERARAQSMIMQHSNELDNTLRVFHEQVLLLAIKSAFSFLWLPDEEKDKHIFWAVWAENNSTIFKSKAINYPLDRNEPATKQCLIDWKSNEPVVSYHVPPDGVENYFAAWSELIDGVEQLKPEYFSDGLYYVEAFMKYGCFGVMAPVDLNTDEKKILNRFAVEFERAYTRFLDLQKAEAQARESQIQLALERVRARTMAMHQSDELADTASILFQQIKDLGFETWSSGFCIWTKNDLAEVWMAADSGDLLPPMMIPYKEEPTHHNIYEAFLSKKPAHHKIWEGKDLEKHYEFLQTIPSVKTAIEQLKKAGLSLPAKQCYYTGFFKQGYLLLITKEPNAALEDLSKRFADVFDGTYTRFLDLKKAEAQAREAHIETSLERVRSRTMGMQKSEELKEVIQLVYEQFVHLNIKIEHTGFVIDYKVRDDYNIWVADPLGVPSQLIVPYFDSVYYNRFNEAKQKGENFFATNLGFEEKNKFYQKLFEYIPGLTEEAKEFYFNCPGLAASTVLLDDVCLYIENFSGTPYSDEDNKTLMRFGKVFQQTYTRFNDLQKAEAQAKEAQIEAALEKVRSRTMAMQSSNELQETAVVLFNEFKKLGTEDIYQVTIGIYNEEKALVDFRVTSWAGSGEQDNRSFNLSMDEPTVVQPAVAAWKANKKSLVIDLSGKALQGWLNYRNKVSGITVTSADTGGRRVITVAYYSKGHLSISTPVPVPAETLRTLERFAAVFDGTYRRFLDLEKAEAQAREAQIELSLERVRSKTMAMHNSQDVGDTVAALFDEFVKLGITTNRCGILIHSGSPATEVWTAKANAFGAATLIIGQLDTSIHPMLTGIRDAWKNKESFFSYELKGDDIKKYYRAINDAKYYPTQFDLNALPSKEIHSDFYFAEGCIFAFTTEPIPSEATIIFKRFAGVFGQTYRRYLDLKKAEAQARHAQIEAAMEKVRARSLAMQKPEELLEVAEVLRKEMGSLGVEELETSSIYIIDEANEKTECWFAIKDVRGDDKKLVSDHMIINLHDTWVGREMQQFYTSGEKQISILMQGENRKEWINYCAQHSKIFKQEYYGNEIPERTYHLLKFSNGFMGAASPGNISAESWQLLQRAATVFSLAYTRFLDLQKAEAQAREAQIEVALERVRSRTLAMQKSDELAETAAVVFRQLIGLGIEPNRLYITIIKDNSGDMEFWITDEDGTRVGNKFSGNAQRNISFQKMYDGWEAHKKSITIDMHGDELTAYFDHLNSLGVPFKLGLEQKRRVQNIAYFSKGFIGMASPEEQPEETIILLERFAAVFNLTYTRFNDLQIAEHHAEQAEIDLQKLKEEKKRTEDALTELQATQKQLIQSEKMASLGELTAGIAHEIQNPLNFVNNFSEVNKEMLEELKAERLKPNAERDINLEDEIINDVINNEEKINHHGKRADAIVKGMLQHSRSSTNVKEPTAINKLTDEYLRLAFHGLRAKDKSFNAALITDYDESTGSINIIPQDIGRVLLNLYTNAFYAVAEKKKQISNGYEPTVSVGVKKTKDIVEISVSDNGNGIPQKIVDKIFQPFFTTKPTGQGTGLGLSLSYDIIKAHGGEIRVETKEGEGTMFIIQLPITAQ